MILNILEMLWPYNKIGDKASIGVQKIAEEGYVGTTERYLKLQKNFGRIGSIIKTAARWPAHIPDASPLTAFFEVSSSFLEWFQTLILG